MYVRVPVRLPLPSRLCRISHLSLFLSLSLLLPSHLTPRLSRASISLFASPLVMQSRYTNTHKCTPTPTPKQAQADIRIPHHGKAIQRRKCGGPQGYWLVGSTPGVCVSLSLSLKRIAVRG